MTCADPVAPRTPHVPTEMRFWRGIAMSDIMRPIPFDQLMDWILTEKKAQGTVFGESRLAKLGGHARPIFGERVESPVGPAAGPNTQLAQNIIASYVTGARFFELKTVQKMDGAELSACVNKPCILAADEGYNCEWSTELPIRYAPEPSTMTELRSLENVTSDATPA